MALHEELARVMSCLLAPDKPSCRSATCSLFGVPPAVTPLDRQTVYDKIGFTYRRP